MALNRALRAVQPGDAAPEQTVPMSLEDAVEAGDYLDILRAQRREIAASLPAEKGPAKAALHRQLSVIAKEIQALESKKVAEESSPEVTDGPFEYEAI